MRKIDPAVKSETGYIALITLLLSALLQAVFLLFRRWDLTVLTGNLLGAAAASLNFLFMGLTVQRSVGKGADKAAAAMKLSQTLRLLLLFGVAALGATLPVFNLWAVLIPLFFPRVAISLQPLLLRERGREER